ncbi:hypothetical protein [Metabacillus litoralis]|uniref:hypothetical protein n=1 Tax=Metabacillus litoralis TaxID=152268 RepID=UPI0020409995|nr:hypothetical protein [Metabacillus litoralis]
MSEITVKILKSRKIINSKERLSLGPAYQDHDLVACTQYGTPLNPANVRRSFNKLIELA